MVRLSIRWAPTLVVLLVGASRGYVMERAAEVMTANIFIPIEMTPMGIMTKFKAEIITATGDVTSFRMYCEDRNEKVCNIGTGLRFTAGPSTFGISIVNGPGVSVVIGCDVQGCPPTSVTCSTNAVMQGSVLATTISGPIPTEGPIQVWPLALVKPAPAPTGCTAALPSHPPAAAPGSSGGEESLGQLAVATAVPGKDEDRVDGDEEEGLGQASRTEKSRPTQAIRTATPKIVDAGPLNKHLGPNSTDANAIWKNSTNSDPKPEKTMRPSEIIPMPSDSASVRDLTSFAALACFVGASIFL